MLKTRFVGTITDAMSSEDTRKFYDKLQPGDLYLVQEHTGPDCYAGWNNCNGLHLHCVLPNNRMWDADSRAGNCTMKDDKTHRCWVRHGDPEKGEAVHVDKAGHTCAAGAGSIQSYGNEAAGIAPWHGFLHHGELKGD